MATVSLWSSDEAAAAYAYGDPDAGHPRAIAKQRHKDFHHESAFIRHAPLAIAGSVRGMPIDGRNRTLTPSSPASTPSPD
jgi:hypothetical protein